MILNLIIALELLAIWPLYDHKTHDIKSWHIEINTVGKLRQTLIVDKPKFVFDTRSFDEEAFDPLTQTVYLSPARLGLVE